jgi:outer membrane receptor protein involved in Fe transport
MRQHLPFIFLLLFTLSRSFVVAQTAKTGTISGKVADKKDKSELVGVNVVIKGTKLVAQTDINGKFEFKNVKTGEYTLEFTYIGYEKIVYTGVKVKENQTTTIDIQMGSSAATIDQDVVVIGRRPLVDIERPQSNNTVSQEQIESAPVRQLQQIINTQPGVVTTPSGVHIRGGRTYETGYFVDGVSVQDPLSGTGFGLDLGSNSLSSIDVLTGGIGAEFGNATSGVVNAKTKSGGDKHDFAVLYKRDNLGFNQQWKSVFNTQVLELGGGGPAMKKLLNNKLKFYASLRTYFTDDYFKNPAKQLHSSLFENETLFAPYQDNRWSASLKMNYDVSNKQKLAFTYLRSFSINQDMNNLRITGNDVPYLPGYPFLFSQQMDNANTYTNSSNLMVLSWTEFLSKRFSYKATVSRLFIKQRTDANGRDWRPQTVDGEFDPNSIVTYPVIPFNPADSVVFVNAPSGFYNNGGIATLWHDHYVEEYTVNANATLYSKNTFNKLTFGVEQVLQDMQWVDIRRPWVGAPIPLPDGTYSQSFRLGDYSDLWKVKPRKGALFINDQIKYKGLIANVGARFEYWAPGKFVDDAVKDSRSPIRDEIRSEYNSSTVNFLGLRHKFRFLPRVSASFPIKENQMLFFNYGHTTKMPHPSFLYAGLNPLYTDRSTASVLGNPNLNPEVAISYELGYRSQITSNDAITISAFWVDNYDFILRVPILVKDVTGREVQRTMAINSDYSRKRGIEVGYIRRIGTWFMGQVSGNFMVATGQSASASEALKEILNTGAAEDTREFFMPWDTRFDVKANALFKIDRKGGLFGAGFLNKCSFYVENVWRAGRRYTPYVLEGYEPITGRPIWVQDNRPEARWSKIGQNWFWLDFNFRKWYEYKKVKVAWTVEITNVLNNKNSAIINPVTGRAYSSGDDVPTEWRDPRYNDPRDPRSSGTPPNDPSRYLQQRNYLIGLAVQF